MTYDEVIEMVFKAGFVEGFSAANSFSLECEEALDKLDETIKKIDLVEVLQVPESRWNSNDRACNE